MAVVTLVLLAVTRGIGVLPGPERADEPSVSARPNSAPVAAQAPGAPGAPAAPAGPDNIEPADSGSGPEREDPPSSETDSRPGGGEGDPGPTLVSRRAPEEEPQPAPESSGPAVAGGMPGPGNLGAGEVARAPETPKDGEMRLTVPKMERVEASPVTTSAANDTAALDGGLLHASGSGFPWEPEANVYIAGHRLGYRNTASYLIFYDLNALAEGNAVILTDSNGKDYQYRVYEVFTVSPDDTHVMLPVEGKNVVTLQTCTLPDYKKRLIVRAERVA